MFGVMLLDFAGKLCNLIHLTKHQLCAMHKTSACGKDMSVAHLVLHCNDRGCPVSRGGFSKAIDSRELGANSCVTVQRLPLQVPRLALLLVGNGYVEAVAGSLRGVIVQARCLARFNNATSRS